MVLKKDGGDHFNGARENEVLQIVKGERKANRIGHKLSWKFLLNHLIERNLE